MSPSTAIRYSSADYLVLDKPADLRMDGPYLATVHKLLTYWYPSPSLQQRVTNNTTDTTSSSSTSGSSSSSQQQQDSPLLEQVLQLHKLNDLPDNELRPCHQLDYATSGVLLVARNAAAADCARVAFELRRAKKHYAAVLHGHVTVSATWPVLSPENVSETIAELEAAYRRERGKRRKDTWNGYQPASALFQQWQQQQQQQQTPNGKKKKKGAAQLTQPEWQTVWEALALTETELERMLDWTWKDVKANETIKQAFESAAVVYNRIQREAHEHDACNPAAVKDLPTLFRVLGDSDDTFHVFCPLAESDDRRDFAMRIPLDVAVAAGATSGVRTGTAAADYKPSLTKVTVQKRTALGSGNHAVTVVQLEPRTGRRHQLRVHTALTGHPIVGDQTYPPTTTTDPQQLQLSSSNDLSERMCLHAARLELTLLEGTHHMFTSENPFADY